MAAAEPRAAREVSATAEWLPAPTAVTVALLLAALWIYKARDLSLPYFWDELGVYGRAAVYMHDHGLGLLPSSLPPELSRGHPLLLVFLVGAVLRMFGATPTVAHTFMLAISSGLVVSVFWVARARWNAWVGVVAAGVFLAQPLFLAQSTLVLPEIPMALACLCSMHAFSRRRYVVAGVSVAVAIFLKETAVILDLVMGVALVAACWRARKRATKIHGRCAWGALALAAPLALYGAFLLVQKHQNGWYLYPLHSHQVDFHWSAMKGTLLLGLNFLFVEQGRMALSVLVVLWLLSRLLGRPEHESGRAHGVVPIFVAFTLAFLSFSAGNVFMKRYLLCLLPPLAILASGATFALVRRQVRVTVAAGVLLCLGCLLELRAAQFNCAYDMSFRDAVLLQRQATRFLEDEVGADKPILANFPTVFGLEDPRYGYASRKFSRSSYIGSPDDEYVFASELYQPFAPPSGVRTELVKRFASPYMNIALYRIVR